MKGWIKKHLVTLILMGIGLLGMGLILYPTFADWWNSFNQSRAVATYVEAVANLSQGQYDEIIKAAEDYNVRLSENGLRWNLTDEEIAEYEGLLDITGTGIMGYIEIPKINETLPIYHGTDESVLQVAIGHLAGTSLPVGGEGSHCVVSGHRGLPSARLFTDLDKLIAGDTWTISVLGRIYTYEVDQIRVVEPTDLSNLQIEDGKDYCTLVTCTPYGINTHRLLVRGHRIANEQGVMSVIADGVQIEAIYVAPFLAIPMLLVLFIILMILTSKRMQRRRARKAALRKALKEMKKGDGEDADIDLPDDEDEGE